MSNESEKNSITLDKPCRHCGSTIGYWFEKLPHIHVNCIECGRWCEYKKRKNVGLETRHLTDKHQVPPKTRYRILQRDNSTCRMCGASPATGALMHVDHIIRVSEARALGWTKAQTDADDNLQTLCETCNIGRG